MPLGGGALRAPTHKLAHKGVGTVTARLTFAPAELAHAEMIAPRLRLADAKGIREKFGLTPLDVARGALERSTQAWAALSPAGEVIALFGYYPDAVFSSTGHSIIGHAGGPAHVWILTSTSVERMKRATWIASQEGLALMLERARHIRCACDTDFRRSLTWLRRLGFNMISPPHTMPSGISYVTFEMRR